MSTGTKESVKAKEKPFPAAVGDSADLLYELRAGRILLEQEAERMRDREKRLAAHILRKLAAGKTDTARGALATVTRVMKRTFQVEDWKEFWAVARRDPLGTLVQKRLSTEAIGERFDAGKPIKGVRPEQIVSLSVTKAPSRGRKP